MSPDVGDTVEILACSYGSRDIFVGGVGEIIDRDDNKKPYIIFKVIIRFEWATQIWWFLPEELKVMKKGIEMIPPKLDKHYVSKAFWIGHKKLLEDKIDKLYSDCIKTSKRLFMSIDKDRFDLEKAIHWHEQCGELLAIYKHFKSELVKAEGIVNKTYEQDNNNSDEGTIST